MSESTKAVFLSYAREDADLARRIAEALRAFGVEVWFDQNELRGGDAWDTKIRTQIKACALFVPLISQRTEERAEGYFRREWKLAIDRTHDMAGSKAFIVPVVIDETTESDASVPEEFLRYQWTRLADGVPTPEFVMQVKRLLDAPKKSSATAAVKGASAAPRAAESALSSTSAPSASRQPMVLGAIAIVAVAAAIYFALRPAAKEPVVPATPAKPVAEVNSAASAPVVNEKSIAVLPFANLSEDKDGNAFFADGVHEDLLTNLAFIRDLRVVSRTSVMQYRNTTKPISEIARELKVGYVLEGSVRRAGNKVRVTGQLIRAATDEHVWASNYDRDLSDVFAIQAELSKSIAGALQSVLAPETKALLERRPTENPAAYDLFLRARQLHNGSAFSDDKPELDLLRRAVELDPKFSAAWATLGAREAFVYFKREQTPEQLALAKAAIDRAVQLAPDDPDVLQGLGDYYYYGYRDYPRATEYYLRLAQMRPNDAQVVASLGFIRRRQGRMPDALVNFRRAVQLDPGNESFVAELINSQLNCRDYASAEEFCRRYVPANPADLNTAQAFTEIMFAAHGAAAELKAFARQAVTPAQRSAHLYMQLQNARAAADWPEAIRLDREQRYFDFDTDSPRGLQDVLAAAVFAEAGDGAAARARATEAVAVINAQLARQPLYAQLWAALSLAHGLLGEHDEALRCGEKSRELLPEARDLLVGTSDSALFASALAYVGEKERALAEFKRLLHVPYGANPVLDRGMWTGSWKPLRDDPRFQALLADPKNNESLVP